MNFLPSVVFGLLPAFSPSDVDMWLIHVKVSDNGLCVCVCVVLPWTGEQRNSTSDDKQESGQPLHERYEPKLDFKSFWKKR